MAEYRSIARQAGNTDLAIRSAGIRCLPRPCVFSSMIKSGKNEKIPLNFSQFKIRRNYISSNNEYISKYFSITRSRGI